MPKEGEMIHDHEVEPRVGPTMVFTVPQLRVLMECFHLPSQRLDAGAARRRALKRMVRRFVRRHEDDF